MRPAALFALLVIAPALVVQGNAQTSPRSAAAPNTKPLQTVRAVISQSEDGIPLQPGGEFQPGDITFFSFQVENYRVGPTGKVDLVGHMQAFDAKGVPIAPADEQTIGTSVSEEDKDWKPKLRLQVQLPSIAQPGTYRIKYDVTDRQTRQTATSDLAFPVGGRGVEPADALTIRNLGFYRTQEEDTPLKVVAYRPGDSVWVRFDAIGYKHGEQNSVDVAYDVAVLSPEGRQMYSQEDAAVERSQAYYPQPWVPGAFNLSLQPTMRPGTYTLVVTARDGVGKQSATVKAEFRVE
jgi:hypothetical protein